MNKKPVFSGCPACGNPDPKIDGLHRCSGCGCPQPKKVFVAPQYPELHTPENLALWEKEHYLGSFGYGMRTRLSDAKYLNGEWTV